MRDLTRNPLDKLTILSCYHMQDGPKKVSYCVLPNYQKIVLKPANEIRFLRENKVSVKHYNIILLVIKILCVTYFMTLLTMPDPQSSDMRHIC